MSRIDEFDVIIAGAGMAGVAAAAALGEFGYRVAIFEPQMNGSKRLGGEFIHPVGVHSLDQLGLLNAFQSSPSSRIKGFRVSFGGHAGAGAVCLPYSLAATEPYRGHLAFGMEHSLIRHSLITALSSMPWVTLFPARLTKLDLTNEARPEVTISMDSRETRLRCRLLIGADGSSSTVSRLAGFVQNRQRISTMVGFLVKNLHLPEQKYGHLFLGGPGPVIAYKISGSTTRFLIDLPGLARTTTMMQACQAALAALPECIRQAVGAAIEEQRPIASICYSGGTSKITRGRLLLVGDSAACCHPITATGLTACARDALSLRDALRDTGGDIPRALALHEKRRRSRQRLRFALAQALYEVSCGQASEILHMRDGLHGYLRRSSRSRSRCMALVSTEEDRILVMLRVLVGVVLCGLSSSVSDSLRDGKLSPVLHARALLGMSGTVLRHLGKALEKI